MNVRTAARDGAVLAFFALAAAICTWPMVAHLGTRLDHAGDPLFNAWLLFRNTETLLHHPAAFWSAPMFYPHADTVAFSENYLWPSVLLLPLRLATDNPILLHNLALWLGFAFSGWAAWRLALHVSGSPAAALAAGLAFAVGPFPMAHLGHFQMHQAYAMPLAILGILVYFERLGATGGAAAALGWSAVALVVQFLCNVYYFLFTVVALALVQAWGLVRFRDAWRRRLRDLALFWAGAALLILPFAMPYVRVRTTFGFSRSVGDVAAFNPDLLSCLAFPRGNLWFGRIFREWARPECELAIGFVIVLLAFTLLALRRRAAAAEKSTAGTDGPALRWAWTPAFWLLALFAFAMSLGPRIEIAGHRIGPGPYLALYNLVPGFDGLRAPGRFAVLTALAFGVLASVALARWASAAGPGRFRRALPWAAVALIGIESLNAPRTPAFSDTRPPEYEALASAPAGVVLEWPVPVTGAEAPRDAIHLFYQARHRHPLINGYSGFYPPSYPLIERYLRDLPSPTARRLLTRLNVAWLGVHTRDARRMAACRAGWATIYDGPRDAIFDVRAAVPAPPPPPPAVSIDRAAWRIASTMPEGRGGEADRLRDGRLDTRWRTGRGQHPGDRVETAFASPATVSEVRIRTGRWTAEHLVVPQISVLVRGEWKSVKAAFDPVEFVMSAVSQPRDPVQVIRFPALEIEGLRIEAGAADDAHWSVAELDFACATGP